MAVVAEFGLRPPYVPVVTPPMPTPSPLLFLPLLVFALLTSLFFFGRRPACEARPRPSDARSQRRQDAEGGLRQVASPAQDGCRGV